MSQMEQKTRFDPQALRRDFPILDQTIHRNRPLIYLDNGASSQRPECVIQAVSDCYRRTYANVHRGIHWLSEQSSAQYEQSRDKVARFINAESSPEVIFTSGTTASINTVARAWGDQNVASGDEILLTIMEHHSNIVPWQQLAERRGAQVHFVGLTEDGRLDMDDLKNKLSDRTRVFAFTALSNVLGTINPVAEMVALAREAGAMTLVDAAQHMPHEPADVQLWNADFVAFSGHKMLGPTGIGVLFGKRTMLEKMPPFLGGGSMIDSVTVDGFTPGELPAKFEAGTPPIAQAIGLAAAIDYLTKLDIVEISRHERELARRTHQALQAIEGLQILGPTVEDKAGMVSFVVDGLSPQDISIFLDRQGVAIRAGHHCAMPLHDYLGCNSSCRASFYMYNTEQEVDQFAAALKQVVEKLR